MRTLPLYGFEAPDGRLSDHTTFECTKRVKLRAMKESDYRKLVRAAKEADKYRACYNQVIYNSI